MTARDQILASVRDALRRNTPTHHEPPVPAQVPTAPGQWPSLRDQFRHRFESIGGHWHQAADDVEAARIVAEIVESHGTTRVLVARDPRGLLDRLDLPLVLTGTGCRVVRELGSHQEADAIGLAVTGVDAAIAESGSLGLLAAPGQGRFASVIAPVHLAVVEEGQLVETLGEFLAAIRSPLVAGERSLAVLITGPSRSGDIEMKLTVGVHGPGEVHVVWVPG